MGRATPRRSTVARCRRRIAAVAPTVLVMLVVLASPPATAQLRAAVPGWTTGDGEAVDLARAGAATSDQSWIDAGLMVPALLVLTVLMILSGAAMVLQRCRTSPAGRGAPPGPY